MHFWNHFTLCFFTFFGGNYKTLFQFTVKNALTAQCEILVCPNPLFDFGLEWYLGGGGSPGWNMTISCIKISAERCLPLWPGAGMSPVPGHTAKFAPHTASLNTVKTNHKIVILFTAEKFITILGGDSQKKNSYRG